MVPRSGKSEEGLLGLHVEGGVVVEALVEDWVGDAGGIELLLEPFFRGDGEDLFEVAGAGAEGEAIEELLGPLLFGERGERGGFCCGWRFGFRGGFFLGVERQGRQQDERQGDSTHRSASLG